MRLKIIILLALIAISSCSKDDNITDNETEYKERMREFVIAISQYAKAIKSDFLIVPQNGIELITSNGDVIGQAYIAYLNAIDANGQEDLFYGYDSDDQETPESVKDYLKTFLNISKSYGNTILVSDYCSTPSKISNSYLENNNLGYISFAADHRELDNIPAIPNPINKENNTVVTNLSQVKNFLYLINPSNFATKNAWLWFRHSEFL